MWAKLPIFNKIEQVYIILVLYYKVNKNMRMYTRNVFFEKTLGTVLSDLNFGIFTFCLYIQYGFI